MMYDGKSFRSRESPSVRIIPGMTRVIAQSTLLFGPLALPDDFKTISGNSYKEVIETQLYQRNPAERFKLLVSTQLPGFAKLAS